MDSGLPSGRLPTVSPDLERTPESATSSSMWGLDLSKLPKTLGRALVLAGLAAGTLPTHAADSRVAAFVTKHCVECHDAETKKGDLDLTALKSDLASPKNFATWVKVHDRVSDGEMPPAKTKQRPGPVELAAFTNALAASLTAADLKVVAQEGRAPQRRLNRFEYENVLAPRAK